jgi:signal transduction histidine kinase
MPVIDLLRRRSVEALWGLFAAANLGAMAVWPQWETIPFHFIWVSLTLVYGFRIWSPPATALSLSIVFVSTGALILIDAFNGSQLWGELFEVPLMSAMFLAMVWHARRRQDALESLELQTQRMASLLKREEDFLHDASHELRTPVTIARGHLELLGRRLGRGDESEVEVALDELARIERILDRLLLLGKAEQPGFVEAEDIDVESFVEDVFMRWSELAPRSWRLETVSPGTLRADREAMRIALDALLENAVKYTGEGGGIVLRARASGTHLAVEIEDEGCGVPAEAFGRIFDRFARADRARTRNGGGVGLGLAIVAAIANAHGGGCTVRSSSAGSTFTLRVPGFEPGGNHVSPVAPLLLGGDETAGLSLRPSESACGDL